jgi:hypothetical protein
VTQLGVESFTKLTLDRYGNLCSMIIKKADFSTEQLVFFNVNGIFDSVISERIQKIVYRNDNDLPEDDYDK